MTLADSATTALGMTAACAVVALLTRVLTKDGAVAAFVVGACVSAGFGLPGLAVLGTFFVVGTLATRIGWATKKARGTAEAGEGRRDWRRVLGKGGVAAVVALWFAFSEVGDRRCLFGAMFAGALAAALADTLGTEIGTLGTGTARALPSLRTVVAGTPGAVSVLGTIAAACGAALLAVVATLGCGFTFNREEAPATAVVIGLAGLAGSLCESVAVGLGLRAPGFVRNVGTTLVGAVLAELFCPYWLY